ncbi:MAG: phosphoribosyl-ATP diphosphatase [Gammaproteobacteria bacterium]|jgi:phosphoribosyl-ATP pyrophosphohydrolase/phosphoribosyl-AMP cyclohydrolase
MADIRFLEQLEALIRQRLKDMPEGSYTAKLANRGATGVAQKVGEEGVELALAGAAQNDEAVIAEAADLLYHMLVLLGFRHIAFADVVDELTSRHTAEIED